MATRVRGRSEQCHGAQDDTKGKGFLPATDAALVERAFRFEVLSEEEQLTHVCDALFCPGDFISPWDAIRHELITGCPGICGAYCHQLILKGRQLW